VKTFLTNLLTLFSTSFLVVNLIRNIQPSVFPTLISPLYSALPVGSIDADEETVAIPLLLFPLLLTDGSSSADIFVSKERDATV